MDKDLLLMGMFQAIENTKAIRDTVEKSLENLLEEQKEFTETKKVSTQPASL